LLLILIDLFSKINFYKFSIIFRTNYFDSFFKSKNEGNTGFYYVRSNNNTLKLWNDAFNEAPKFPKLDDQAVFWRVIRLSKDPPIWPLGRCRHIPSIPSNSLYHPQTSQRYLVSCLLDSCVFSSGMLSRLYEPEFTYETLTSNLKILNESIVSIHANYLSGNRKKMLKMQEHGLWLAEISEDLQQYHCKEYKPLSEGWTYPTPATKVIMTVNETTTPPSKIR
jgi:hypothetical protein